MKSETASYQSERLKLQTQPIYVARFCHVKKYGQGSDYPFSVDFVTRAVNGLTRPQLGCLGRIEGAQASVIPEQGRATIGTFSLPFLDISGEITRYMAAPPLTLKTAMTAGAPGIGGWVEVNEAIGGLPAQGTLEIVASGYTIWQDSLTERVRYDQRDDAGKRFRVSARGVDDTPATAHYAGDPMTNGEQIRPGMRVQLFAGYAALTVTNDLTMDPFMALVKMEVVDRQLGADAVLWVVQIQDIQRTLRRQVFLAATQDAPVILSGNPIDIALRVITSKGGSGTPYAVAGATNASPIEVTTEVPHGFLTGDQVLIYEVEGNEAANGVWTITKTASDTFTLDGSTGDGVYTTGGIVSYASLNGEFDNLPVENGLAVPVALVDTAGIKLVRDTWFTVDGLSKYRFKIVEPQDGKTWLEENIWRSLNCYPWVTQKGEYTIRRYQPAPSPDFVTETLDESDLIAATWVGGDRQIINRVITEYDWDSPSAPDAFGVRRVYSFEASIAKYGVRPPLVLSCPGIRATEGGNSSAEGMLDDRAFTVGKRFADPPPALNCSVFYRRHTWEVGDCLKVSHSKLPGRNTGLRGITAEVFEILSIQPRFGAAGRLDLTLLDTGSIILPAAPSVLWAATARRGVVNPAPSPGGLQLVGQGNDDTYTGRDIRIEWHLVTHGPQPGLDEDNLAQQVNTIAGYLVIVRVEGIEKRRTTPLMVGEYEYSWERNVLDNGASGARTVTFEVYARTIFGNDSEPAILTVTNPVPDMSGIMPTLTPLVSGLQVDWSGFVETDLDFDHYEVFLEATNPPTAKFTDIAKGTKKITIEGLTPGVTYYCQVKPYDAFGAGVASPVANGVPRAVEAPDLDTMPPATPTGLALASAMILTDDGTVQSTLDVSWAANAEADLDGYILAYRRQGDTNFTIAAVRKEHTAYRQIGVVPNRTYEVKIRALDVFGNASAFTGLSTILTATDSTAPAAPTGLSAAVGTGKSVSLHWADNTDDDFAEYGVYRHTSDLPGSATKIAEVRASRFVDAEVTLGQQYYYWVSAFDRSENQSAKSTGVSAMPVVVPPGEVDPTAPSTPAAPTFSSDTTYLAGDGAVRASIVITNPAMPAGGVILNLLYQRSGASQWQIADQVAVGGGTTRVDDLSPGVAYVFAAQAYSRFGTGSAISATLSRTAPGDTGAPAAPTDLAATVGTGKSVSLDWADNTESDFSEYGVWRNTINDPGTATKIAESRASRFVDTEVVLGTTYYYWVSAFDRSENQSAKSTGVSAMPVVVPPGEVDPTAPSTPAAFAKVADGTYLAGDGTVLAYLDFTLPAMPTLGVLLNLLYKPSAAAQYLIAGQVDAGSVTLRIDDLTSGRQYDVAVQAISRFGTLSTLRVATASPFTAPGDATPPSAPSAIAVRQNGAKIVEIDLTFTEPVDWGSTELYRNTTDNSGTAALIETRKAKRFHDENVSYGTTYFYWVKVVDQSGNKSGFSPSSAHSVLVARLDNDDVKDGAITASASGANDADLTLTTTYQDLVTVAMTVATGEEVYVFGFFGAYAPVVPDTIDYQLVRDSTTLVGEFMYLGNSSSVSACHIDAPNAGSYTYKLQAKEGTSSFLIARHRRLVLLKRRGK